MPSSPITHPEAHELSAYGLGRLDEAASASIHDHLEVCEQCRAVVEAVGDDTVASLVRATAGGGGPCAEAVPAAPGPPPPLPVTIAATSALSLSAWGQAAEAPGFLAPPQEPGEIGRLGSYRVLRILGAGGMGVVFQAQDPHLDRLVALKTMLPGLAAAPEARLRFQREARAAAALKHDNVVTIHQVGEDRGVPYLAMEFLEGEALDARLKREGRLPVGEVLRIGREVAEGLAAAHERGLIHRDIKPGNIWLEKRGGAARDRVKILDFGLARPAADPAGVTQSGGIVGTPAYMAPEQSRALGIIDHRADLFSLGCVLYRMSTGELPFNGPDTLSVVTALALDDPPPPRERNPDVPAALSDLTLRLLAKRPEGRPASAAEVARVLEGIADGADPGRGTAEAGPTGPAGSGRRRRRWVAAVAALAGLVVLGGIVYLATDNGELVIDCRVKDAQVVVSKDGQDVAVLDVTSGTTVKRLASGDYQVALRGDQTDLRVDRDGFTLSRWGKIIVTVRHDRGAKSAGPAGAGPGKAVPCRLLAGHTYWVNSVAFSPDGKTVAAATGEWNRGGEVRLWDLNTFRALATFAEPASDFTRLAFAPDGKTLACGGWENNSLLLWDVASRQLKKRLGEYPSRLRAAAFTRDGALVAAALSAPDAAVEIWDVAKGEMVRRLAGHRGGLYAVAFSPDGQTLASAGNDGTVLLWDVPSGELKHTLKGHESPVYGVAFSPDGATLASCAWGIRLWDARTGAAGHVMPGNKLATFSVAFSPDGKRLASGHGDKNVRLWDPQAGKPVRTLEGHGEAVTAVTFSPDGSRLASASRDRTVRLWQLRDLPPQGAGEKGR